MGSFFRILYDRYSMGKRFYINKTNGLKAVLQTQRPKRKEGKRRWRRKSKPTDRIPFSLLLCGIISSQTHRHGKLLFESNQQIYYGVYHTNYNNPVIVYAKRPMYIRCLFFALKRLFKQNNRKIPRAVRVCCQFTHNTQTFIQTKKKREECSMFRWTKIDKNGPIHNYIYRYHHGIIFFFFCNGKQ